MTTLDPDWERFLLAEHKLFRDSFWKNEEVGEKRVNYFITLATAVLTALVALASVEELGIDIAQLSLIGVLAILMLLCIGIVMLNRMIKRNKVTDKLKAQLDMVRDFFKRPSLKRMEYTPFDEEALRIYKVTREKGTGGLVDMVMTMNSLMVLGIGIFLITGADFHIGLSRIQWIYAILVIGSIAILAWFIQGWIVERKYAHRKDEYKTEFTLWPGMKMVIKYVSEDD